MPQIENRTSLAFDDMSDNDLLVKSMHLVYFRLAFALVSLVVSAVLGWIAHIDAQPIGVFYAAGFTVAYTVVALLILRYTHPNQTKRLQILNGALLFFDIIALSALVHFTRGIESDLYFLYLLPTVLASHTFGRRGIFVTAFGASLAYVATLLIESYSFLPYVIGTDTGQSLTAAYSQRLWSRIATRASMLVGVSFIWALFCEHMSRVAQQGATRLRGQLDANNGLVLETKAHAAREQLINAIGSSIRSTLEIDEILITTVNQLSGALGATRCAIITPSEHIGDSPGIWEAFSGTDAEKEKSFSRNFSEFVLDNLAQYVDEPGGESRRTFVYENPLEEESLASIKDELKELRFKSMIAQPMMYGSDSKGVILIGESANEREWNYSEIELTKAVAGQVAIAIEHARLVDQLSRKNRDLLQKNLNLDSKNLELRTMQSTLVHQEKMASLGRMVAGIAHELNNPINFVHGNLPYLREYFEDLKQIIASVDSIPEQYRKETDAFKRKTKYDFLVTDLDHIIADLAEGAERIRQIIKNLRSFSRLDEAELKEASIQEGIESTIKILNQYYGRDKIQAECKFAEIPPVVCYPGKLNQVWMNLLSNAAQAVSELEEPRVSITTELEGDWVVVSIADNGTGIKPHDQSKIFEPFYTTKPVGQGTGLGLSICHSIIERHGGNIWFETTAMQGTTFKVKIPLKADSETQEESRPVVLSHE